MREAAEIRDVAEAVAAGGEALVAAGRDAHDVARGDRPRRALPQIEKPARAMGADLDREPGIGAHVEDEPPAGEMVGRVAGKPRRLDEERPVGARHGGARRRDRERAARIPQIRVAGRAEDAPALLVEPVHQPAQFRDEGPVRAPHLADRRDVEQEAMLRRGPVDEMRLDARVVVEPRHEIRLRDPGRDERARHLPSPDREAELARRLRGLEPGAGTVGGALEGEVAVVVGEAEHGAVAPLEPPTARKRRRPAAEPGGEAGRYGAHGRSPGRNPSP